MESYIGASLYTHAVPCLLPQKFSINLTINLPKIQTLEELADEEKAKREEDKKRQEKEKEEQELIQEREFQEKEEKRRVETKRIFAEKIRLRQLSRVKDWTLVPCPGGDVPTWRPDLILCGPGKKVTIEKGGNLNPRPPDWDPVLAAEALTFYATDMSDGDWVIDDFSEFEIKLDFLGEPLHITFKKD